MTKKMNYFKNKDVELVSKMDQKIVKKNKNASPFDFLFVNYFSDNTKFYEPNELNFYVDTSHTDNSWLRTYLLEKFKPEPVMPEQQILFEFDDFDIQKPNIDKLQLINIVKKHNEDNFLNNLQFVPNPPVNVIRNGIRIIKLNIWKEEATIALLPRMNFRLPMYS